MTERPHVSTFKSISDRDTHRAEILLTEDGDWYIEGLPPSRKLDVTITELVASRVPDGTVIDRMWLWITVDNRMMFSYLDMRGNVRSFRVNPGTFS